MVLTWLCHEMHVYALRPFIMWYPFYPKSKFSISDIAFVPSLSPRWGCHPLRRISSRVGHHHVFCPVFSVLNVVFPPQNFVISVTFWPCSHFKKPISPPEISPPKNIKKEKILWWKTYKKKKKCFLFWYLSRGNKFICWDPFPRSLRGHLSSISQKPPLYSKLPRNWVTSIRNVSCYPDFCPSLLRLRGEPFRC